MKMSDKYEDVRPVSCKGVDKRMQELAAYQGLVHGAQRTKCRWNCASQRIGGNIEHLGSGECACHIWQSPAADVRNSSVSVAFSSTRYFWLIKSICLKKCRSYSKLTLITLQEAAKLNTQESII